MERPLAGSGFRIWELRGAVGPHWNFHARQDPHAEDLVDSDLPGPLVAEDPREYRHGPLPGKSEVGSRAVQGWRSGDRVFWGRGLDPFQAVVLVVVCVVF